MSEPQAAPPGSGAPVRSREYGVLVPHFGSHATPERVVQTSVTIERYGFDSVWMRDHVVYHPHTHEDQDRTHVDPIVGLSAVAGATRRVKLATGSLIPHRHPIHAAGALASLDFLAGPDRLIVGFGLGTYDHEFDAVGMAGLDRRRVLPEQVEILRALWAGGSVTHHGEFYDFEDVELRPVPGSRPIPIWYCGMSRASVRRAVEYCDGWIPGRMPMRDYRRLLERMDGFAAKHGRPRPATGAIPLVVPDRTVEAGMARLEVAQLAVEMERNGFDVPPSGGFAKAADFDGAVIAGPAVTIVEEILRAQELGVEHFVFDLRARFADYEECIALLGEEVLPSLRRHEESGRANR